MSCQRYRMPSLASFDRIRKTRLNWIAEKPKKKLPVKFNTNLIFKSRFINRDKKNATKVIDSLLLQVYLF